MGVIHYYKILLIALFFLIESLLARPSNDTSWGSKHYYSVIKEFDDLFVKNNILNGIIKPVDDRKTSQRVFEALKNNPEHVAQIDAETGKHTTYREMLDRSIRLALWMKKQGVQPNNHIVLCTHNHLDSYIPLFATLFVDAIFTAWSQDITLYTARRFTNLLSPKLIFTNEKAADMLLEAVILENSSAKSIVFGKHSKFPSLSDIMNAEAQDQVDNCELVNKKNPQDGAFITFSSSSSGFPKAAVLPDKILVSPDVPSISSNKVVKHMWHADLHWISKIRGELGIYATSIMNTLAKSGLPKKYDLRSLQMIMTSGSIVSKEMFLAVKREIPRAFIGQTYGMTEADGVLSSTNSRSKHVESAGILVANRKAKIVDIKSGETLGPNSMGELYAESPSMMIGYYGNPDATKNAIDTQEIEEILMSHPQVQEVAVVPIPVEINGERPVAFVQIVPGSKVTKDELMKLTSVLEDYKKLVDIHFMKIPHLPSGKISKLELTELANDLAKNKFES